MKEDLTVGKKLDKILEAMEDQGKKQFRMPLNIRFGKGKLRKEYAIVQLIRTNGNVTYFMRRIQDDTVKIGDNFYDASAGNILRYKKLPLIIIPEWSMKPFSPKESFEESAKEGTLTAAEKLILTRMKQEAITSKMSLNFKTIIILIIFLGIGYGILSYLGVL